MQITNEQAAQGSKAAAATKHAARIAAATLAAQTFNAGRVSLFDSARVTGAALKAALHSMVSRTLNSTPGISPRSTARVVFAGEGACVKHEWSGNDKAGLRIIAAVIMLPDFDDTAHVPRAFADELCAYTLHELAHCLFTNPRDFAQGVMQLSRLHNIDPEHAKGVFNAIEDVRIERALLDAGHAAGFKAVVRTLCARNVTEAKAQGCMQAFAAGDRTAWGFAFAFGGRGYAPGAEAFRGALTTPHRVLFDDTLAALGKIKPDDNATKAVFHLADAALRELAFDAPEPGGNEGGQGEPGDGPPQPGENGPQPDAPQPDGPQGQPGAGDASEGEEGGEPGEGEGEGAGEGEGEGEGEGGTPGDGSGEGPEGDDTEGVDGHTGAGEGGSKATNAGTGTDQPAPKAAPAPGTFADTELAPQGVPESCKPSGGVASIFPPRVTVPDTDAGTLARGASHIAAVATKFQKAGALQTNLRRLFTRSDRDMLDSGLRAGRLRVAALPRVSTGAENVFARRTLADGANSAVSILIDGSGSMAGRHGSRAEKAANAAALLVRALAACNGVRSKVQIFQEGSSNNALDILTTQAAHDNGLYTRYSDVRLTVMKDYADAPAVAYGRLAQTYASGSTPDLEAIHSAGLELAQRPEARKVFIVMIDGGTGRHEATAQEVAMLKKRGVTTIAVGIAHEPEGYEHAINVTDLNDLGGAAFRKLCDVVARETAGA